MLLKNAISSIRMGFEDFSLKNQERDISAIRNLYAGILLLAKEVLIRNSPNIDPKIAISSKIKLIRDQNLDIKIESDTNRTIDFSQIIQRFKDFNINIDMLPLKELNKIRNDVEHHYTNQSSTIIRQIISKGLPIVGLLLREIEENPVELLGDVWSSMLQTKEVYDKELESAKKSFSKINWHSPILEKMNLTCPSCNSELVGQIHPENTDQNDIELQCNTCGYKPDLPPLIEAFVNQIYGGEAYIRCKEALEDGPIYNCPVCNHGSVIEEDGQCVVCGEEYDMNITCDRCGEGISFKEYHEGSEEGLCSYCSYQKDRIMSE